MPKILFDIFIKKSLLILPSPINISYWWNIGSLLGLFLFIQIIRGFFLSTHYCPNTIHAFNRLIHIIQNVNYGWLIHNIHINGASIFFICIYFHLGRGVYYNSFKLLYTWSIGVTIFLTSIATAFLGYVLPWGQISFWGATVITNLISTVPFFGTEIVQWLWGGYSVRNATLNRFYSLHFILPFVILIIVILHLYFLHLTGSSNPLGINRNLNKIPFNTYYSLKDLLGFVISLLLFTLLILITPYLFRDPDNFLPANPLVTPIHIQPEWYFLFAYRILRAIPNKLGGVIALFRSICVLYFLPITTSKINSSSFYPLSQLIIWLFFITFTILTWLGSQPIEYPYIISAQFFALLYFIFFILFKFSFTIWDFFIYHKFFNN